MTQLKMTRPTSPVAEYMYFDGRGTWRDLSIPRKGQVHRRCIIRLQQKLRRRGSRR